MAEFKQRVVHGGERLIVIMYATYDKKHYSTICSGREEYDAIKFVMLNDQSIDYDSIKAWGIPKDWIDCP